MRTRILSTLLLCCACGSTASTTGSDDVRKVPTPVDATEKPRIVQGNYTITNTADLDQLSAYVEVTGTLLIDAPGVTSLHGLEGLARVGELLVEHNDMLQDLTGLGGLTEVQSVRVANNPGLRSLWGLHNVATVTGSIQIEDNPQLARLDAFHEVQRVGGYISVHHNPVLEELRAFTRLTEVHGLLALERNELLHDLSSLGALQAVGDALIITRNPVLLTLAGLGKVQTVRALQIEGNSRLMRLADLVELHGIWTDLRVRSNPVLPACEVLALRDRVLANGVIGGEVVLEDNEGTGCQ
ncbi:MAG: hypothetical protein AB2A00_09545 [Myxococcota bacterium]